MLFSIKFQIRISQIRTPVYGRLNCSFLIFSEQFKSSPKSFISVALSISTGPSVLPSQRNPSMSLRTAGGFSGGEAIPAVGSTASSLHFSQHGCYKKTVGWPVVNCFHKTLFFDETNPPSIFPRQNQAV
jgi:hypothetical protein